MRAPADQHGHDGHHAGRVGGVPKVGYPLNIQSSGCVPLHGAVNVYNGTRASLASMCCRGIAREPMYVELDANPTVDAEHPPDLKHLTDAAEPSVSAAHGDTSAASAQPTASAQQNGVAPSSAKHSPAMKLSQPSAQSKPQATDVAVITSNIISKVNTAALRRHVTIMAVWRGVSASRPLCCASSACEPMLIECRCRRHMERPRMERVWKSPQQGRWRQTLRCSSMPCETRHTPRVSQPPEDSSRHLQKLHSDVYDGHTQAVL